ncbi:ABC transporter substrate-binding protein [Clostridium thermarum]|uniref:ABC transporter substrate-binding protein n=1 Tax=Clostridium thermarum TaxID=1716543 RepID=UPI0013D43C1F|nr:extracellular solute-binding protein [Clostridium thermarum]
MKKFAKIAVALSLTLSATILGGCGSKETPKNETTPEVTTPGESTPDTTTPDSTAVDPAKVTGTVNFAVYNWGVDIYTQIAEEFNKVYPNVTVNITGFDGELNDYLTTQAASNSLPDVVFGWSNINYPVSQGWVMPLDEFLAKDPDIKYVEPSIMEGYKFNGKTYAVPQKFQFSSILVNLDLIEQLNLDKPSYEWTIDEFKEYATKATTDKISGINHLWDFDESMIVMYSQNLSQRGFDLEAGKFNFTDGSWVKAITTHKELKAVPGLVSDDLKNQALRDKGKEDDYMKKFGKDADALRESKVAFGFHGTWDIGWIKTMPYKYDFYPIPIDPAVGYKEIIHADHGFMMSTAQSPEAAFEFLKWITYGTQGTLVRLEIEKNKVDADGNPTPEFFIPATSAEEVVKVFKEMDIVPEGVKFMYDNMDKSYRGDLYKIVPDFTKVIDEIIRPQSDLVREGKVEASAIAAELEQKANEAIQESISKFDNALK